MFSPIPQKKKHQNKFRANILSGKRNDLRKKKRGRGQLFFKKGIYIYMYIQGVPHQIRPRQWV